MAGWFSSKKEDDVLKVGWLGGDRVLIDKTNTIVERIKPFEIERSSNNNIMNEDRFKPSWRK